MAAAERVRAVVAPAVTAAGLVLEQVTVTPAGRRRVVRVVVDLPESETGSVDLDRVAAASRAVSAALDADDPLGADPYVLEVGTPGVDRPLTERRHWARARGRLVQVPLPDGSTASGRVLSVDGEGVVLGAAGAPGGGAGQERRLPWQGLGRGRVQVEFSRPDGDDGDGGDDGEGRDDEDGEG